MNDIETVQTDYIRNSRTIELIKVTNKVTTIYFYLYNYEGTYFTLFPNLLALLNYFGNQDCECLTFDNEEDVDNYLINLP